MEENKEEKRNQDTRLTIDIDYNKLADAIVRAQKKAETGSEETEQPPKEKFFPLLKRILNGEKSEDGRFLTAPFAAIISVLFRLIAVACFLSLIAGVAIIVVFILNATWAGWAIAKNIFILAMLLVVLASAFLYAFAFWAAANDVDHEKDKNYISSVFSAIISVAALIVAILALYKGIG